MSETVTLKKSQSQRLLPIAEAAIFVALAYALSWFKIEMPNGGSITPVSMLPIIVIGYRRGPVLGLTAGVVYSLLQMLQSFAQPPVKSFSNYVLVVALDYVIAFTILGLSGFFRKKDASEKTNNRLFLIGTACVIILRFLIHLLSGIIIWSYYAPDGMSPFIYSFTYNGTYMGVELVTTMIVAYALVKSKLLRFRL
jgi:thiamine transporter